MYMYIKKLKAISNATTGSYHLIVTVAPVHDDYISVL